MSLRTESGSRDTRRGFLQRLAVGAAALPAAWMLARRAGAAESREDRRLGVALVGLGGYSTGQLGPALRQTKRCRLAGVVTGSPEKARRWAREYGLPERNLYDYESLDRIADNPDIDIVYVVTPPGLHAELAIRAARAGKHVISEKPMAVSVAECDAMIDACRQAGVMLSIGYRLHFHPSHQELARLARERDFGPLMKMSGANGFTAGRKTWRMTKKLGGGGPLMDMGIYVIQAACIAAGGVAPVAVRAHEEPKTRPDIFDEVEETLRFTLEFGDGAICEGITSFAQSYGRFRAEGDEGWIELDPAFAYRGIRGRTSRGPLHFPPMNQQAAQMDDFASCIMEGRPTIVPGEMGRRDMRIITAIYEAARRGERVTV